MVAPTVPPVSEVACCPNCASSRLHPQRFRTGAGTQVTVELRCVECSRWTEGSVTRGQLAALDHHHTAGRAALQLAYERCVAESMEAMGHCLAVALERDLVGADDFAPRRAALT